MQARHIAIEVQGAKVARVAQARRLASVALRGESDTCAASRRRIRVSSCSACRAIMRAVIR